MLVWLAAVPIAAAQETWTQLPAISGAGSTTVWEKAQSKAWFHGHTWWTVLPASGGEWLFRLEPTNTWTPVLQISTNSGRPDTLVVGDVTHVLIVGNYSQGDLVSLEYIPALQTYQLWSVRPTETPISVGDSGTLAMDSTGRLWVATPSGTNVEVFYADAPYSVFAGPIVLDNTLSPGEYDMVAVAALSNHTVGVMWSNVTGQVWGFRAHVDGADPNTWLADEVPDSAGHLNSMMADNHLHVTVAADGTLYAVGKAASVSSGVPQLYLMVRHPNANGSGTWDSTLYRVADCCTRPIVVLNDDTNTLRVYFTDTSGGNLYVTESARSPIQFSTPVAVIGGGVNNATSAKAPWHGRLVVLAANGDEQSVLITTTPGLVGYWKMNDGSGTTAQDFSGWGNDATLVGSPTWVPVANGLALNLNGSTTYGTVTDQAALASGSALTLSAWIRPHAQAEQVLISRALSGTADGYELALGANGKVFARLNQASSGDSYRVNSSTSYPTTGTAWMHVAATYDGSRIRLYINGVLEGNVPGPLAIGTGSVAVGLGAQSDGTRLFNGALDEVRIYNRALSSTDIAALASSSPAVADLSVTNNDSATSVIAGQSTTYQVRARNLGPDDTDATVTDSLPAPATGATWTCSAAGGAHCTASGSGGLNDAVHLPVGGSVTYLFQVTVAPGASGTLTNTATVQSSVPDPVASNNSATDTDTILQPPAVTTPPANLTVTAPNAATFSVVASGTTPFSYQWRRNGTPISGATSASYTLNPTASSDSGAVFSVVVSNTAGTVTSTGGTLTVNVAPAVTTAPANLTVTAPNAATFSVVASGTTPLSYQWRRNGTPISGATSASYTLTPTATTDSGALFDVVVGNVAGTATSAAATLTVNASGAAPSITTPPANVTVTAPNAATFSVVASGTTPLSYQWRRNGTPIGGATSASYTLSSTATTDSGALFDVVVTNGYGTATSAAATLTVNSSGGGGGGGSAAAFSYFGSFSRYPTTDNGKSGSSKDVAIAPPAGMSAGQLAIVFAVYRDTGSHGQSVSVSTTGGQAWTASAPFLNSTGHLYIRAFWTLFNGTWSASPSFALTTSSSANAFTLYGVVFDAPAGTAVDVDFTPADLGDTALLSHPGVTTTADGALVFGGFVQDSAETLSSWTGGWTNPNGETQWRNKRGDDSVFGLAYQIMGAAGGTGPLSAVSSGSAQSAAFMMAFHGQVAPVAPTITTPPANVTVTAPNAATFSVTASGTAPLSYQWRRNGTPIGGATSTSYTLTPTAGTDSGAQFDVVVTNGQGTATSAAATLTVNVAPSITTPPANVTVTAPNAATFSVTASGTAPLSYQWRRNGTPIGGATGASYTLTPTAGTDDGAQFDVVVSNLAGTVTSTAATLTVNTAPSITTPPANVTVTAPNAATFSVVASGTAPLSYQWWRDGTPIGGATGSSYTLNPTATTDSGAQFDVVVTNGYGMATSAVATLTVDATAVAPSIATPPANVTVTAPNAATFSVVASGTAPLSYQWRRNGTPISGATGTSYTLTPTATTDSGALFDVVVSNVAGSVTSTAAALTVTSSGGGGGASAFSYFGSFSRYPTTDGGSSGSSKTVAITPPAGMTAGQLAVVFAFYRDNGNHGQSVDVSTTGGQAWNASAPFLNSTSHLYIRVFWTLFNGTWSASPSFALTTSSSSANAYTLYGVVFNAPAGANVNAAFAPVDLGTTGLVSHPGVTTTVSGALVLGGFVQDSPETFSSWTSGWTNPNGETQWRNNRGDDSVFGLAYKIMGGAGATGSLSAVASSSNPSAAFMIAFGAP